MNIMCNPIPARGESNKSNKVLHGLSNQKIGNKLQRCGLNLRPLAKLGSAIMLNDQPSYKFKLVGFEFNVNIMPLAYVINYLNNF